MLLVFVYGAQYTYRVQKISSTKVTFNILKLYFLANRTATQATDNIMYSVRLSLCNALHCGSQSRCTGIKVVPDSSPVVYECPALYNILLL